MTQYSARPQAFAADGCDKPCGHDDRLLLVGAIYAVYRETMLIRLCFFVAYFLLLMPVGCLMSKDRITQTDQSGLGSTVPGSGGPGGMADAWRIQASSAMPIICHF